MPAFLIAIVVAIVLAVVAYMLMPKAKTNTPDMARDLETPTSEAGRPIPVVFGDITIKSPNCLWYGQVQTTQHEINV
ncbi:hypothetical protein [Halomonas sp. JS92-SW72]|uniref:hypothetical protein n=1 Tax=Halomonas sp. JS92-SW72 TaxID=2306583 RepID=UPI000E5C1684|nr:hypothetical protein [Halomonas sp. JS92-SW72]AXY41592.1 hypothetical protein D1793_04930 [Halomonas sp. JS92-SW72]